MRKTIFLVLFLYSSFLFSQKEANIWYFGRNAGIDFNTSPPTPLIDGQLNTLEGCSTFSDENGNLLLYSDGITVWDKNHNIMKYSNGALANNLRGDPSSTQSGMIIPKPKSSTIYYLFTVDDASGRVRGEPDGRGLNFYTIDISKNGGLGEIVEGPVSLSGSLSLTWPEKVAAVRGTECDTFWVVSVINNTFYSYKIDETGVSIFAVISSVPTPTTKRGYLKLSPDGTKLAVANQLGTANLYNFNATTGEVDGSSEIILTDGFDGQPYGVEFSVDSRKLYISTVSGLRVTLSDPPTTYRLIQFDLLQTDIPGSKALIHRENPGFRGALQLGPDSKIYATIPLAFVDVAGDDKSLDVIENPNANARDVIYTKDAIDLGGRFSTQGLPPFISSLLLPIEIIDITANEIINNQDRKYCIGDSIEIDSGTVTGTGITHEWTFNDGLTSTVISNQPKIILNNLNTSNNGTYSLVVNLTNNCGEVTKLEGNFTINVFEPATASPISDINHCDSDGDGLHTFDFETLVNPTALGGLDPNQFNVVYYQNRTDAETNNTANVLTLPYSNTIPNSSEDIFVRVHNKDAPNACFDITQFRLSIFSPPVATQPTDYEECDDIISGGDTDGFFNNFILSTKDSEILGGLSPTQYSVTYHTSLVGAQTDATTDIIDKNTPYRNTTINEQTIYVRVENITNINCVTISDPTTNFKPFKLIVNSLPVIANNPAQITQCEIDGDGSALLNLTQATINLSANFENEDFDFFPTEADAISNSNKISTPFSYNANNGDTIWARVISDKGCYRIAQVNIIISFTGNVPYTKEFTACDDNLDADGNDTINNNDKDGIANFNLVEVIDDIKNFFPVSDHPNLDVVLFETTVDRDVTSNPIPNYSKYRNTNIPASTRQPIYFKVINNLNFDCEGIGEFYIKVDPLPDFEITTPQIVCLNAPSFIEAENPDGLYQYEWTRNGLPTVIGDKQQLDILQGGDYTVTAINTTTNCRRSKTIRIEESIIATITPTDVTIMDDSDNNTIDINDINNNLGIGDYEFALQDENAQIIIDFQDAPIFENLEGGIYTILVRDKNNCGTAQLDVSVLQFPKYFTPNNDGVNDTWTIKGASSVFYPNSTITIFDRFGKIMTSLGIDDQGWNGLFNGKLSLPTDYWFNIELIDRNGNKINRRGHFSLLRQ
ncbi:T9SS type B sorting domain-containing protein [Tenacibaculum agarivorans]|uniref:T9SS type B sorting domain-containing protein n=1 Tax=Tenacibaculum agarivorans TaxID=1908389 RepID=UPI00117D3B26|nr:T9SS type B sorting domain-containing protein [Tenacibaculum agarivorans]